MKTIFEKWWDNGNKVFSIINYKKSWKEVGNKPLLRFRTNGAKKSKGDKCLDVNLEIGYTIFNYCNFDLQGKNKEKQTTFCYCPNCRNELISSNSFVSDEEVVTYKCVKCGVISEWDFDVFVPFLLKHYK